MLYRILNLRLKWAATSRYRIGQIWKSTYANATRWLLNGNRRAVFRPDLVADFEAPPAAPGVATVRPYRFGRSQLRLRWRKSLSCPAAVSFETPYCSWILPAR